MRASVAAAGGNTSALRSATVLPGTVTVTASARRSTATVCTAGGLAHAPAMAVTAMATVASSTTAPMMILFLFMTPPAAAPRPRRAFSFPCSDSVRRGRWRVASGERPVFTWPSGQCSRRSADSEPGELTGGRVRGAPTQDDQGELSEMPDGPDMDAGPTARRRRVGSDEAAQLALRCRELEARLAERSAELERRHHVAEGLHEILTILNSCCPEAQVLDSIVEPGSGSCWAATP